MSQPIEDGAESVEMVDRLAEAVRDPTKAPWRRFGALRHLVDRDALPVEDKDGAVIIAADIEHGRGIGCEPDGYWASRLVRLLAVDCPECPFDRARETSLNYATVEHSRVVACLACGHVHDEESTL